MIFAFALVLGCAGPSYDRADLQLDVAASLPADAERLRVCVVGSGVVTQGAGNGRAAITGLPADEPADVTVVVLDDADRVLASAGPTRLDGEAPWATTPLDTPGADCDDPGSPAAAGNATWLLAVRFDEAP